MQGQETAPAGRPSPCRDLRTRCGRQTLTGHSRWGSPAAPATPHTQSGRLAPTCAAHSAAPCMHRPRTSEGHPAANEHACMRARGCHPCAWLGRRRGVAGAMHAWSMHSNGCLIPGLQGKTANHKHHPAELSRLPQVDPIHAAITHTGQFSTRERAWLAQATASVTWVDGGRQLQASATHHPHLTRTCVQHNTRVPAF